MSTTAAPLPPIDDHRTADRPPALRSVPTAAHDDRSGDDPTAVTAAFAEYRRTGDRALRNSLVEDHRSLAEALARRYMNRGEAVDDLEQVAFLGLVKAVDRFDPSKGIPFAGFAVPTITGEIRRHFRDHTWAVKVHRAAKDLHVRLPAVSDRMTGELGRPPTASELAVALDCRIDDVIDALDAGRAYRSTSTDTTEGSLAADHALVGSDVPGCGPEDRLLLAGLLAELSERDRTIIGLRFFEELTQGQIAERVGVSQVHVSRLLRTALARLRAAAAETAEAG